MAYPKISLNDFTIRQAPFPQRFDITRQVGFSGIEFQIEDAREYAKQCGGLDPILGLLHQNHLKFTLAFILRECLSPYHSKDRDAFLRYAEQIFRDTQRLEGKSVLACSTFGPADLREAPELFAELCDLADSFGLDLALEFIGWAETIKDIATTLDILGKASRKNGGMVYDTLQHYLGGSSLHDLEEIPSEYLFSVHIADADNLNLHPMEIGRKHRLLPGQGVVPIPEILDILHAKGYDGWFALEIFNDEYLKRSPLEVAYEGFESMLRVLSKAGFN